MKKEALYLPIGLMFLGILVFLLWGMGWIGRAPLTPADLTFRDTRNGLTLSASYDQEADTYLLFLPACTAPGDVTVDGAVSFSQEGSSLGENLTRLPLGQDVELALGGNHYIFQLWQCDNLPTLSISASPGTLDYLNEDKWRSAKTYVTLLSGDGQLLLSETGSVSGRGNGTWELAEGTKRPYNLSFSRAISFGPFQNISSVCLFAEYLDESKLRNSLAYYAGQALGLPYASPYMYVNVYFGGEYLGLYGITTKQEYTKHIQTDGIQAVFEFCTPGKTNSFVTSSFGQEVRVLYGEMGYVADRVNWLEAALENQDWGTCGELMDPDSLALLYTMEEFLANYDMTYASQYFYIGPDGRICAMLPWDFDHSMGSAIFYFDPMQAQTLFTYRSETFVSPWWADLLAWEDFRLAVENVVRTRFTDALLDRLEDYLEETIPYIRASRACDIRRWQSAPPYSYRPTQSGFSSLEEFCDFFMTLLQERRDFLSDYFAHPGDYRAVTFTRTDGTWYTNVFVPVGSRLGDFIDWDALLAHIYPDDAAGRYWSTASGLSPEDLDTVTEDLTFLAMASDPSVSEE